MEQEYSEKFIFIKSNFLSGFVILVQKRKIKQTDFSPVKEN